MELLCTLSKMSNLEKIVNSGCDGVIFGSAFSLRFNYNLEEMKIISEYCKSHDVKRYISIDAMIFEDDRVTLYDYFDFLRRLKPDGIYFTDLGIVNIAKRVGLLSKLIYDPDTLMTNSVDASFYLKQGIDVVLARELSFPEVFDIVKRLPNKVDMQVFGHLKMSYSKRQFLTNYFKHLDEEVNVSGKKTIRIVEENRNYSLPIVEDKYGTRIYSDYVLLMYNELAHLKSAIKRAIVEDSFVDINIVTDVIKDIRRLTEENSQFLTDALVNKYQDEEFSNGYLEIKTTKTKE